MITSTQNALVKRVLQLQKKRGREKEFLIEGFEELKMASKTFEIVTILFCSRFFQYGEEAFLRKMKNLDLVECSEAVFKKVSYRDNPDGILGIAKSISMSLDDLEVGEGSFFLIAENIEKPGNLGAILRSCDGAGAKGVIVVDEGVDIYNPNVIRASLGTVFSMKVVSESKEEVLRWLRKHEIKIVAATPEAKTSYSELQPINRCAFVVGREHEGLTPFWKKEADFLVKIPMKGKIDSLNVSVAAALLLFEASRWNLK